MSDEYGREMGSIPTLIMSYFEYYSQWQTDCVFIGGGQQEGEEKEGVDEKYEDQDGGGNKDDDDNEEEEDV